MGVCWEITFPCKCFEFFFHYLKFYYNYSTFLIIYHYLILLHNGFWFEICTTFWCTKSELLVLQKFPPNNLYYGRNTIKDVIIESMTNIQDKEKEG